MFISMVYVDVDEEEEKVEERMGFRKGIAP